MDDDRAVVARQIGREPRAFRRVAVRCPYGRPAVTEQEPYDEAGEPFPTTYYLTCPHLVGGGLAARGGRRRRALVAGRRATIRRWRRASSARTRSSAALRRELPGRDRRPARDRAASSACTPTPRSRLPGPATSSASGSWRRSSRCGPTRCCTRLDRRRWRALESTPASGTRATAASQARRRRPARYARLLARSTLVLERAAAPRRPDVHARRARLGVRRRRPLGAARLLESASPRRAGRPARRSSRTRRSTSTRAARSTTGHERLPAAAQEALDSPARRLGARRSCSSSRSGSRSARRSRTTRSRRRRSRTTGRSRCRRSARR